MNKRNNGSTEQEKYQNRFTAFITASIEMRGKHISEKHTAEK